MSLLNFHSFLFTLVADDTQQISNKGFIASRAPGTPGTSDVDKLFAKFLPTTATVTNNNHGHTMAAPASIAVGLPAVSNDSRSAASMSVQSLFASVTGSQESQTSSQILPYFGGSPSQLPLNTQQQQVSSTTGLSLLDSIFASAAPTSIPLSQEGALHSGLGQPQRPHYELGNHSCSSSSTPATHSLPNNFNASRSLSQIPMYTSTPKSLPTPQVLCQNVIGSLLNHGGDSLSDDDPKRQRDGGVDWELGLGSHANSGDEGNGLEIEDGSWSGGTSSEGGRGTSVQLQRQKKGKKGKSGKIVTTENVAAGLNTTSGAVNGAVEGDVTPRPGSCVGDYLKNLIDSSGATTTAILSSATTADASISASDASSSTQREKKKRRRKSKAGRGRLLVPVEPSSELCPYPPSQQHNRDDMGAVVSDGGLDANDELTSESESSSMELSGGEAVAAGGDIVELDWEDISALSDLKEFERVQREQQQQKRRRRRRKGNKGKGNIVDTVNEQEEG